MRGKLVWATFWALVGTFLVIIGAIFIPAVRELLMGSLFLLISGTVFFLLGAGLIFLAVKQKVGVMSRRFLLLTGAAAAGFVVSVLLHNAVYGLFIYWFGADFWDRIGLGDEPVFFFMAILVCPVAFLVGAIGTIALAIKRWWEKHGQQL